MQEMAAQNRRADLVTLAPTLKDRKVGETFAIRHLESLVELYSGRGVLTSESLDAYVAEIHRYSAQRAMAKAARELMTRALSSEPDLPEITSIAVGELDRALLRVRSSQRTAASIFDCIDRAITDFEDENAPAGIRTGLRDLDAMTGGLYRGELSILAGRPGSGKTTIATQIGLNAAKRGVATMMFSLEMGKEEIGRRLVCSEAFSEAKIEYTWLRTDKIAAPKDRKLGATEMLAIKRARDRLRDQPLLIEDRSGLSVAEIATRVRSAKIAYQKRGPELGLIIVDHLGLVKPTAAYKGQKVNEVGEVSAALKALSKQLNVHVLALHQINRAVEGRDDKRPQLHDLRDSGNLEQDADLVMFACREAYYLERKKCDDPADERDRLKRLDEVRNILEINIQKQRAGIVGSREYFCHVEQSRVADLG